MIAKLKRKMQDRDEQTHPLSKVEFQIQQEVHEWTSYLKSSRPRDAKAQLEVDVDADPSACPWRASRANGGEQAISLPSRGARPDGR